MPGGDRFVALDSLRGFAATLVAAGHVPTTSALFSIALIRHEQIYVDFFFVLSGFVIAGAYRDRLSAGFPLLRFMILRLGRLLPLHLFMLAAWLAIRAAMVVAAGVPLFSERASLPEFLTALFLVHGFDNDSRLPWNGPSWSISVEVWMYLLFGLGWTVLRGRRNLGLLLAAGLSGVALLALALDAPFATPLSGYMARGVAGFGLGTLVWQVRAGGVGAALERLGPASLAMLQGLVLAIAIVSICADDVGVAASDCVFAVLVLVMAVDRGAVARAFSVKPFQVLGRLSYSIYLVHGAIILVAQGGLKMAGRLRPGMLGPDPVDVFVLPPVLDGVLSVSLVLASIAAAALTYRWVEAPARALSRREASRFGTWAE